MEHILLELILIEIVVGSVGFALFMACLRVGASDPGEDQTADQENKSLA